ncbi:MAG: hypothetical protein R3231_00400 [bacterium]|nr:hypothetical protein [bacterium]
MGKGCERRGRQGDRGVLLFTGLAAAFVFGALYLFLLPNLDRPVSAHSVHLHAYVAGERCFVQGLFNGAEPASHARIEVFDGEGNRLLEGTTDEKGAFSFPVTATTTLNIVLTTPLGHRGQTRVAASETGDRAPQSRKKAAAKVSDHGHTHSGEDHRNSGSPMVVVTQDELQAYLDRTIDEALEEKLTPLYGTIAKMEESGTNVVPRLLSGIGYIVGIFGLAMYIVSRRKQG